MGLAMFETLLDWTIATDVLVNFDSIPSIFAE